MLFGYGTYVLNNIVTDTWNEQSIGNSLYSSLSKEEKNKVGLDNCKCPQLKIRTKEKVESRWLRICDELLSSKHTNQRMLHFLVGSENPYWNGSKSVLVPDMKYSKSKLLGDNGIELQDLKIKMTGGLKDHFDSKRFSLRVKSHSSVIKSIRSVNFYNPKVRLGGLHEWFVHELLADAGLAPLRTGYVNLNINERVGIYFYQEQPTVDMLVDLGYKPGLIVRVLNHVNPETQQNQASLEGLYDENSLLASLYDKQIRLLNEKLIDYNAGLIKAGELYSVPKLAQLAAVIDLTSGYHGLEFRNMYYYFNPQDLLLEPIAREFQVIGYSNADNPSWYPVPKPGRYRKAAIMEKDDRYLLGQMTLKGEDANSFETHYTTYLTSISRTAYLDSVFEVLNKELVERQNCLFLANPEFAQFDKQYYYSNQVSIQDHLNGLN